MQRFKLGFRNKSAAEQLILCERTITHLAAKPEYQSDPQQLADASATVAALRASHDRIAQLRSELAAEISHRNQLLSRARAQVARASLGVSVKVGANPSKLMEAGLELEKSKNVPVGKPAAPDRFRAEPTAREGEVRLRWRRPLRRCWFEIQYSSDSGAGKWIMTETSQRQTCMVGGLKPGGKYWFRVRAVNAHGAGPWSGLAVARVK